MEIFPIREEHPATAWTLLLFTRFIRYRFRRK
jgi:hypothetical protein